MIYSLHQRPNVARKKIIAGYPGTEPVILRVFRIMHFDRLATVIPSICDGFKKYGYCKCYHGNAACIDKTYNVPYSV